MTPSVFQEQNVGPFPAHPTSDHYFPAAVIEDARQRLTRTITRGGGIGLVIGAPGCGKSLLMRVLAEQFHEPLHVACLACGQLSTLRSLLQAILFELQLPYRDGDDGELALILLEHLTPRSPGPNGLLLLVDEAQNLPVELLEQLRMLSNLVRDGQPQVRTVLAGTHVLEEALASPGLESLNQRIATRCFLVPFNTEETIQYIRAQVAAAGADPDQVFEAGAYQAVFAATDGVPRLINQLCDRSIALANEKGRPSVDETTVNESWSDLQQLPVVWQESPTRDEESDGVSVVEFGGLSDELPEELSDELSDELPDELPDEPGDLSCEPAPGDLEPRSADTTGVRLRVDLAADLTVGCAEVDADGMEARASDSAGETEVPTLAVADEARGESLEMDEAVDPFGETFDEEEVVLDQFASLGDAFHDGTPRVENLSDAHLALMVKDALEARHPNLGGGSWSGYQDDGPSVGFAANEAASQTTPQPAATVAIPLSTARVPCREDSDQGDADRPEVAFADFAVPRHDEPVTSKEPDILIIEDYDEDLAVVEPAVQFREYRQLFSQLRGG